MLKRLGNWLLRSFFKLLGWLVGGTLAVVAALWTRAKLVVILAIIGAFIGTSAGIAMFGGAINAAPVFAVFGAALGIVAHSFFRRAKTIQNVKRRA